MCIGYEVVYAENWNISKKREFAKNRTECHSLIVSEAIIILVIIYNDFLHFLDCIVPAGWQFAGDVFKLLHQESNSIWWDSIGIINCFNFKLIIIVMEVNSKVFTQINYITVYCTDSYIFNVTKAIAFGPKALKTDEVIIMLFISGYLNKFFSGRAA